VSNNSSTPPAGPTKGTQSESSSAASADIRTRSAVKAAATVRRHREERRAESLDQIRDQIAAGTLVVRQMTPAQRQAASEATRLTQARNEARKAARENTR
jgi:hypothetical protein